MGGMNKKRPTALTGTMNHAKTSVNTEIFAGAIITVVQYLAPLRYCTIYSVHRLGLSWHVSFLQRALRGEGECACRQYLLTSVTFLAAKAFAAAKNCLDLWRSKTNFFRGGWRPESRQVINSTGELGPSRTPTN
jgi:hypothetical protein